MVCDIPGLSEFQKWKTKGNKIIIDDNDFKKLLLKDKEEFDLVYIP